MKNFIFYLVSKIIKTNSSIVSNWHIERGKETPDSLAPYYFHLPLKDEENFSIKISEENHTLRLTEHHITIHEVQTQEYVQYKSPYHYTAIFIDQKQEKSKLHLFFDSKDKICSVTFNRFSVLSQAYTETVTLDAQSITQFELFAKLFIINLISKMRLQQTRYISELTEQCLSLNTKAEEQSKNITSENVQFYIENLEKYITVLQEIKQLSGENNQGIQNLLLRRNYELKKQFLISKIPSRFVDQHAQTKDEKSDLSDAFTFHPTPLRLSLAPIDLDPKIMLLQTQVESLETSCATQPIPAIIEKYLTIYNDYLEISSEIALYTHDTTVSMSGLSTFEKTASQLTTTGTALLEKAILKNSFEKAAKLNMFHGNMPLKYLNMALTLGNAPMLEFLLQYGTLLHRHPSN